MDAEPYARKKLEKATYVAYRFGAEAAWEVIRWDMVERTHWPLEYIDGLPLAVARQYGWDPELRVDLPLAETAGGGSPSVADVGQQMLAAIGQALALRTAAWTGYTITVAAEPPDVAA